MTRTLAFGLSVLTPILLVATPAFAMKGIDAARACNARPDCRLTIQADGSVDIYVDGREIYCAGPKDECLIIVVRPGANQSTSVTDLLKTR